MGLSERSRSSALFSFPALAGSQQNGSRLLQVLVRLTDIINSLFIVAYSSRSLVRQAEEEPAGPFSFSNGLDSMIVFSAFV